MFPIQSRIPTLQFINEYYEEGEHLEACLAELLQLEEKREEELEIFSKHWTIFK